MSLTHAATGGAHEQLVEQLDQHVRELVRREAVDPQRDAAVVRRIAEGVVSAHDDRSLTGQVAPVPDVESMVGELVARVSGFGPLQPFLDDPAVEEVWINDPSRVFIARNGRHELTNLVLTSAQVQELVERMLKSSGRRIDLSQPFVDAMLPEGHRLHVVLEGISHGFSAVNLTFESSFGSAVRGKRCRTSRRADSVVRRGYALMHRPEPSGTCRGSPAVLPPPSFSGSARGGSRGLRYFLQ